MRAGWKSWKQSRKKLLFCRMWSAPFSVRCCWITCGHVFLHTMARISFQRSIFTLLLKTYFVKLETWWHSSESLETSPSHKCFLGSYCNKGQHPWIQRHVSEPISSEEWALIDVWIIRHIHRQRASEILHLHWNERWKRNYDCPDNISQRWPLTDCWCTALFGFYISGESHMEIVSCITHIWQTIYGSKCTC